MLAVSVLMEQGGSWKVHGGVPGAQSAGQLWGLCDLEGARPRVVSCTPQLRWGTLLSLSPQILATDQGSTSV